MVRAVRRSASPPAPIPRTRTSDTSVPLDYHERAGPSAIARALALPRKAQASSEEALALLGLCRAVGADLDATTDVIARIGNRQRILTGQLAHLSQRAMPAVRAIAEEGRSFALLADEARTPEERKTRLREAAGRVQGALLLSQLQRFQVAYLALAGAADDAGYPSSRTVEILASVDRALAPLVEAALTFESERIQEAIAGQEQVLVDLQAGLTRWQAALERGTALSKKGIAMADAALIVLSIYQAGRGLGGIGTRPGLSGLAGNGTAVAGVTVATEELAEAVRKLVELGALDASVVSKSPGFVAPAGTPEPILRETPSGTIVPARGPFAGKEVRYGDPRSKHTRVASKTLEQMRRALAKPRKAKGVLKRFVARIARGDTEYGSQLSKEATDRYEALVRDAVENGRYRSGKFHRTADDFIGIDVETGQATKRYRVDLSSSGHGAHVLPVAPRSSP